MITRPADSVGKLAGVLALDGVAAGTELEVAATDICVVVQNGAALGRIVGGQHTLPEEPAPMTLVFVTMSPLMDQMFAGDLGMVRDPATKQPRQVRMHGKFTSQPMDPEKVALGVVASGDPAGLEGQVRSVLAAQARDSVAAAVQGKQLDLDNPAAGIMAVAVSLANDASLKLADQGVRVMSIQELNITAAEAEGAPAAASPQAAPAVAAAPAAAPAAGQMPPDPIAATGQAFAQAANPLNKVLRVENQAGVKVDVGAGGVKVDKNSVKDAVKRKASKKLFGCILSAVIVAIVVVVLLAVLIPIAWIVYTSL